MGICLLLVSVPKEPELRNYRISRRFLAGAYNVLSVIGLWVVFGGIDAERQYTVRAFTVITPSYQSMLFTFSTITLINMRYMTAKRVYGNLLTITLFAVVLLLVVFHASPETSDIAIIIAFALYSFQLVYYVWLFRREYRQYKYKFDNFFSGEEYSRSLWIRQSFYMAACVGIMVLISPFGGRQVYLGGKMIYTIFYVYFAVKYVNYLTLFHRIAPVVVASVKCEEDGSAAVSDIRTSLARWVSQRKYLNPDITLEILSHELCTNNYYLSRFINSEYGQNFRSWINSFRITEAIRIMEENNDLPTEEIAERIGILSTSTFYRQFLAITGVTPAEYRKSIANRSQL